MNEINDFAYSKESSSSIAKTTIINIISYNLSFNIFVFNYHHQSALL